MTAKTEFATNEDLIAMDQLAADLGATSTDCGTATIEDNLIRLSPLDAVMGPFGFTILYIFPPPENKGSFTSRPDSLTESTKEFSNRPYDLDRLRSSFMELIEQDYPIMLGKLHVDPVTGVTSVLQTRECLAAGAKAIRFLQDPISALTTADAMGSLPMSLMPPEREPTELISVKTTILADGGMAIGVNLSHCLVDGEAMFTFMKTWGMRYRGVNGGAEQQQQHVINHDKSLLFGKGNESMLPHPEFKVLESSPEFAQAAAASEAPAAADTAGSSGAAAPAAPAAAPAAPAAPAAAPAAPAAATSSEVAAAAAAELSPAETAATAPPPEAAPVFPPTSHSIFHLSPEQLKMLRSVASGPSDGSIASEPLDAGSEDQRTDHDPQAATYISTIDSLSALMLLLISQARGHNKGVRFTTGVNGRRRLIPQLPQNYCGNVIFNALSSYSASELSETTADALHIIARKIRQSIISCSDKHMRDAIEFLAAQPNLAAVRVGTDFFFGDDIMLTSWANLGMYDADFGSRPWYVGVPMLPCCDGMVVVMEGIQGAEGLDVLLLLESEASERFKRLWNAVPFWQ
ncbi:hypothetical protein CLOM_g18256 [Closterium sp. NIES-68]|nr:hypothetical protein CLOM_g18256 [Closterium sp. NIES-68]GJP63408.1 hypothetical protein CLOP_g20494 [Closterium sp. NIES-67]